MTWIGAIPTALCCVAILFLPGMLVTYPAGLRGVTAVATAPLVTVAVAATSAVAFHLVGIPFAPLPVLAVIVGLAVVVSLLALLLRRRVRVVAPRDPRGYLLAAAAGVAVALAIGIPTFVAAVGSPGALNQSWDAIFHYNSISYIAQSQNGSALSIGNLGVQGTDPSFYPAAWQDIAALLVTVTGADVAVVANLFVAVLAVLVWPLSCLALARQVFGHSGTRARVAALLTGAVSVSFGAFPWGLMNWGTLWPNLLGIALLPLGLAIVMALTGIARTDAYGRHQRWLFAVIGLAGLSLAHPNTLFSLLVFAVVPVLILLARYLRHERARGRLARGVIVVAVLVVATGAVWVYLGHTAIIQAMRASHWQPFETASQAVGEVALNATNGTRAEWLFSLFMLVGAVMCFVWRSRRWLVVAFLLNAALYVGAAAIGSHLVRDFTGFWYGDSHRLAATLPVVAIPLTVVGLTAAGESLAAFLRTRTGTRVLTRGAGALGCCAVLAAALIGLTRGGNLSQNVRIAAQAYPSSGETPLVGPAKRDFFATIGPMIPDDAVVANNPWQGTAALSYLEGVNVLVPALRPFANKEIKYLTEHLNEIPKNQQACAYVRKYHVEYLVTAPRHFGDPNPFQLRWFAGLRVQPGEPGFRLVAAQGHDRLYRITACGIGPDDAAAPRSILTDATGDSSGAR